MPTVSIVIPTRNRATLLVGAIRSALSAGSDVEVIVIDDASTDETAKLCASFPQIIYSRLARNQGLSAARNAGIEIASTEYVAFLDDDDLRIAGKLDAQVQALNDDPAAAFCYGPCLIADARRQLPTGEIYPDQCATGDIFWELMGANFVPMPTVVARKTALIEVGLFNTALSQVEDWDMWLRLSEQHTVLAVDEPVALYRRCDGSSAQMSQDSGLIFGTLLCVQEMAFDLSRAREASPAKRRALRRKLRAQAHHAMVREASNALLEGNRRVARQKIRQAFSFRPFRTLMSGRSWVLLAQR